jgi:Fibronectin type III domain
MTGARHTHSPYRHGRAHIATALLLTAAIAASGCGGGGGGDDNAGQAPPAAGATAPAAGATPPAAGATPPAAGATPPSAPITRSATLQWAAPADARVQGYRLYHGTASHSYSQAQGAGIDVGNASSFRVENLQAGQTYYFAVTAYDASANESAYSDEVSKQLP